MRKQKPLFSIYYSESTGAYQLYLEEADAIADLISETGKELGFEFIKNLTDASHPRELGTQFGIQTYEYLRYNMPETAVKVATMTENEALDLAQAIIATVRKKRNVTFLEIVK
jgi:hypothetical protein